MKMNKLKKIALSAFIATQAASVIAQDKQYQLPNESVMTPLTSGGISFGLEASCSGVSFDSIAGDTLNSVKSALDNIKSDFNVEGATLLALMYSSPRLWNGMNEMRGAADAIFNISSSTCGDIQRALQTKADAYARERAKETAKCMKDSGKNKVDCSTNWEDAVIASIEKYKKENIDEYLTTNFSVLSILGFDDGQQNQGSSSNIDSAYTPYLPKPVLDAAIENFKKADQSIEVCENDDYKDYILMNPRGYDCTFANEYRILYPLYNNDNSKYVYQYSDAKFLYRLLYNYYADVFEMASTRSASLNDALKVHKEHKSRIQIDPTDINKVSSETNPSKLNRLIEQTALRYAWNNLELYATGSEQHFNALQALEGYKSIEDGAKEELVKNMEIISSARSHFLNEKKINVD